MAQLDLELWLLVLRLSFVALLYLFLLQVVITLRKELGKASEQQQAPEEMPAPGRLVVVDPGQSDLAAGQTIDLRERSTIGRAAENTIVLNDNFVSASHAVLAYQGRRWWIEDQGSTNGTYVNNRPIARRAEVAAGDTMSIGRVVLKLVR